MTVRDNPMQEIVKNAGKEIQGRGFLKKLNAYATNGGDDYIIDDQEKKWIKSALTRLVDYYDRIGDPDDEYWTRYSSCKISDDLAVIVEFNVKQKKKTADKNNQSWFLLAVAAALYLPDEESDKEHDTKDKEAIGKFCAILQAVKSQFVRRYVMNCRGSGKFECSCFRAAKKLLNHRIDPNKDMSRELSSDIAYGDKEFKEKFEKYKAKLKPTKHGKKVLADRRIVTYMLVSLSWRKDRSSQTVYPSECPWRHTKNDNSADVQVEHILPQEPAKGGDDSNEFQCRWCMDDCTCTDQTWSHFSQRAREEYTQRLGNLTLLSGDTNSRLSNACWECKRKAYRSQELCWNKEIAEKKCWDCWSIATRQTQMAELAVQVWPGK